MSRLLPEPKPFALQIAVCRGDAVGRAIRRQLAFLMTTDGACRRYANDSISRILCTFDRRFCGIASGVTETFDPLARVVERRAHICGLLLKPAANGPEKPLALLRLLIWGWLVLRDCQSR
jgi:hypothetical protein